MKFFIKSIFGLLSLIRRPSFYLFLVFSLFYFSAQAQTDTRFWFAAPDVTESHGDRPVRIVVSAFDVAATVTVTQPGNLAFPTYIVAVAANSSEIINFSNPVDRTDLVETPISTSVLPVLISNRGLLVESTAKITAYYEVNNGTNNDMFALKGKNGLGLDFYVPFQNTWRHQQNIGAPDLTRRGRSGFVIVATEDNTSVTVTPTRTLEGGQSAAFSFTLNKGQTYVASVSQPTATGVGGFPAGSRVQADKPVAVTKYSDSINTGTDASPSGCYDLAGDQLIPVNVLGREYVVLRGRLNNPELVVVTATVDNTQVSITGAPVVVINRGQTHTYAFPVGVQRVFVSTTENAYVGHYAGFGCETGFAILPPVDCTGSLTTRVTRSTNETFFINLMTRGAPVGGNFDFTNNFTIRVNGAILFQPAALGGPFFPAVFSQIGTSNYYATQYEFTTSQVPANAVVTVESTTITAGTNEAGLFHLGVVNGGAGSGTRYGYFSDFRALDLGSDININYGTNTTITADIQATNFQWYSDGTLDASQTTNVFTITDIQRRQTIKVIAKVGDCFLTDSICVGTNEYVWDGSITTVGDLFPDIDNPNNWSKPCGQSGTPGCKIDIIVPPTPVATSILTIPSGKTLNVRNISILSNATGTINGNLNVLSGGQVNVCGDMVHNGTLTMEPNSIFKFVGLGRQDYSKGTTGLGDFENLYIENQIATSTFKNVPGVTILSSSVQDLSVSATGSLNFMQGYIIPEGFANSNGVDNSRSVVIKNPAPNAVTGFTTTATGSTLPTDYFIAGKLNRAKGSTGNYSFPVGLVLQDSSIIQPEPNKNGTMQGIAGVGGGTGQSGFENDDWTTATYGSNPCNPSPNGVLKMDDSGEYIDFDGNKANVGVAGGAARTVEIWANVANFNGGGLFQFGAANPVAGDFALMTTAIDNSWEIRLGGDIAGLDLINLPNSKNNWRHYALTYNGDNANPEVAFYYDGQLIRNYELKSTSTGNPIALNTVMNWALVGKWIASPVLGTTFRGQVDELKVWTERRTTAQIKESFDQGCASNALQCPQSNNLKAYYNFNDGQINGKTTRIVQSRTITCPVPTFTYQRADANFTAPSAVDNVTGSFKQYITLPNPVTGQIDICGADFDTEPALDNGFWNFSSFAGTVPTPNATYVMYLYNRDFGNNGSGSTTVMQLDATEDPYAGLTPPWNIPAGLCEANTAPQTGRSGFVGNMGFFATAQSLDPTLLPIQLLSLTAKPKENAILVEWTTLQELDNYGFDVFRAEENGDFVKIGFVASKGQSQQGYNFLDVEVEPNINYYYKLKQIDNNGKFNFTKTVMAKLSDSDFTGEQINTIYPNPTDDEFTLYLGGKEFKKATQIQITLINAIGEQLETKIILTQSGNRINFKLTRYPKGIYFLKIVSETSSMVMKVVKE